MVRIRDMNSERSATRKTDPRLDGLSDLLDKGIEEEANRREGELCSRCDLPDKGGKFYKLRVPTGAIKLYRCGECSILTDHWLASKFSDRAFAL
jgi:hypothetical protein